MGAEGRRTFTFHTPPLFFYIEGWQTFTVHCPVFFFLHLGAAILKPKVENHRPGSYCTCCIQIWVRCFRNSCDRIENRQYSRRTATPTFEMALRTLRTIRNRRVLVMPKGRSFQGSGTKPRIFAFPPRPNSDRRSFINAVAKVYY